jgi:hypothetical protein
MENHSELKHWVVSFTVAGVLVWLYSLLSASAQVIISLIGLLVSLVVMTFCMWFMWGWPWALTPHLEFVSGLFWVGYFIFVGFIIYNSIPSRSEL